MQSEAILQQICVGYLKDKYPDIIYNVSLSGIKLSGNTKYQVINTMKAQGWVTGIPDVTLHLPNSVTLCLELKTIKGRQSEEQKVIENRLTKLGHTYLIVRTLDDLKEIMTKYYIKEK